MAKSRVFWMSEDVLRHMVHRDDGASMIGESILAIYKRGFPNYDVERLRDETGSVCQTGAFGVGDEPTLLVWYKNGLQRLTKENVWEWPNLKQLLDRFLKRN